MRDELKENDRMSVITFERSATRIHGLVKMTPENKSLSLVQIKSVHVSAHVDDFNGPNTDILITSQLYNENELFESKWILGMPKYVRKRPKYPEISNTPHTPHTHSAHS